VTTESESTSGGTSLHEELLSSLPGAVFQRVRRSDGRIEYTYLSDGVRDLFDIEPAAAARDAGLLLAAVHPGDRDLFSASLDEATLAQEPWDLEFRITTKGGGEKWVRATSTVRKDGDGDVYWNGIVREITGHKDLQREAARQQETITAMFANMAQGMIYYNSDLVVTAYNNQALEMLGLPASEIEPNQPFETWLRLATRASGNESPLDLEERVARRIEIARRFEPYSEDLIRDDGRIIEVRGRPVSHGGFVLTYTDVTERKTLERRLRRQSENLAEKSELLARQLTTSRTLARTLDRRNKELSESHRASEFLANHDVLTGLPNRRMLLESLSNAMRAADSEGIKLALLYVDLDNFKRINDTCGHIAGDGVLVEAGRRLRGAIRDGDIVARLGGDEFAVLMANLPHDGRAAVVEIAERLRENMKIRPEGSSGDMATSASIGVAFYPGGAKDCDELLQQADHAMYEAKRSGRDAVVVARQ
jgi:diguanylate cyclase (GGDEF)-like protein/PAS domain S-box-containing protein